MRKLFYLMTVLLSSFAAHAQKADYRLVVGTYTKSGASEGIYVYDFNTATAALTPVSVEKNVINPSYLTVSPDKKFVYAVNENGDNSTVSAFNFDVAKGNLSFINKQSAKGADPCFIIADDKNVIIANYSGGSIAVYSKDKNGALSAAKQVVQHTGSGIDKARQASSHVHMVRFSPDGKYVMVNDLGDDKVYVYTYNKNAGKDVLVLKNTVSVKPGSGPRQMIFSTNGKFAYLLQEMHGDVTVFSYNDGVLKKIQETSQVAENFKGKNGAADIQTSADGKFVYLSNRGTANNITTFAVAADGKLVKKGQISTGGKGPRAFVIDPSGKWLLVGNQNTDDITIFKRNSATGELQATGKKVAVGSPVSFAFVKK